ncbi:hypothetical protein PHMEG_00016459 [Phytophthora megakarya]|uniref:Uncharacterized protein n=1 Tax=Phytophthora megakarya TaxID=4795 RepID=A0A225VYZ6_9STRA|nr:hypothetical protein PHMEG_00016459 [Phytophthora megakarya]
MAKANRGAFAGLKLNGKASDFQRWKDTVVAHLTSLTNRRRVSEFQAGREPPRLGYEDLLTRPIQVAAPGADGTADERKHYELEMAFLVEQETYLRDMSNQTLPHGYLTQLGTPLASQLIPACWLQLEADFGQNNAMGMTVGNRLNRQGQEMLRVHLLPSQLMIGKVLSLLPSHLWGPSVTFTPEEFTLEKVEKKMKAIFGNKSKAEIQTMGKTGTQPAPAPVSVPVNYAANSVAGEKGQPNRAGKRKALPLPTANEGVNHCFYCNGIHNDMNGIGSHFKRDCPKRNADMAQGVGPAQATVRKEIPVDATALQRLQISDTTEVKSDRDEPMTPGPRDTPMTPPCDAPVVSSSAADSGDEDMNEFDGQTVTAVNYVAVTSAAEELEKKAQAFEDKDAATA